ncbi:hypothetical protein C4K04_1460 [Pseudomonas chlororaphis]|uniref:Uncharacterized protein n=1 Tax=Pseudomonas chlororaphis TaxID=587753 RepID=A0A3G7TJJ1_9PSED|nr:hypothetical protein [Pseudomonas chlororaphis]AZE47150.1 hypothetical protein C4K04_1460 [Pseudomonas chlororaphis]
MKLTHYIYNGPQSAANLRVGEARELLEVQLQPGKPVELPADHEYTLVLLELKHLVLAPPDAKPAGKTATATQKSGQE